MEAGLKLDTDLNPIKFPLCYNRVGKWLISSIKDDEHIGPWLARGVEWENWMRQDVEFAYKPGTDILDLGGNIGCNALMFSDYGPVHTFEPLFHKIIQKNIEQNSLSNPIQVYPFGLSSAPSDMNIYFPKTKNGLHNYGCCSVQPNKDEHSNTSVVIHLERLDDVYKGVPSVMKIDVEGHELAVLKGADATIRRHMPALIVEIHHFEESPVSKYIQNLGYTRCVVRPHGNYLFLL
jgi:FkbM family methyltransferase